MEDNKVPGPPPGKQSIPRLVIAGTHSGVGKTTVVTGLLAALRQRGLIVQSYKVGPDYIDPGYHQLASGRRACNLDCWLVPDDRLAAIFAQTAAGCDIAIIEGVMGLYDGGKNGMSSTAAIAKLLRAPVVLVIDARSMGESAAAVALGYKLYDPLVELAGVIINRLGSDAHQAMVFEALERIGIPVLGCLKRDQAVALPERHLGLTPVTELDARQMVERLGAKVAGQTDLAGIVAIARAAPPLPSPLERGGCPAKTVVRIGVACDEAFSFYYPASLAVLEQYGAELALFSPLRDNQLPAVDGLILGGGFPEMFVNELAANQAMRQAIKAACQAGLPVYAECGGLMYLTRQIIGFDGQAYDMAGVVPAVCAMQSRLETVGYVEAAANGENLLCDAGTILRGHEFHFSRMIPDEPDTFPWAFRLKKVRTGAEYQGGYVAENVLASYLHIHFAGHEQAAARFVDSCRRYKNRALSQ